MECLHSETRIEECSFLAPGFSLRRNDESFQSDRYH
jgi:hypothetical protein